MDKPANVTLIETANRVVDEIITEWQANEAAQRMEPRSARDHAVEAVQRMEDRGQSPHTILPMHMIDEAVMQFEKADDDEDFNLLFLRLILARLDDVSTA